MRDFSYQEVLCEMAQYLPMGYTCQKPFINGQGQVEDFVFLDSNPAFDEIFELDGSATGKRATEVFASTGTIQDWMSIAQKTVNSEKKQEATFFLGTLGSSIQIITHPLAGNCFIAYYSVKTQETQTTEALRWHNGQQAMFEKHSAVMLLTDPITGRIMDANLAACEFYGYTRAELKDMGMDDISPTFRQELQRRHLNQDLNGNHTYLLFSHRLKSGQLRTVDIYSSPIRFLNRTYFYSIVIDVTSREKYRNELYHKKEMLSITLKSIGDGVVTTDKHGLITSLNRAAQEMTGWEEREALNAGFSDVFQLKSEETGRAVDGPVDKVLQTGKVIGLANHTALVNKGGASIPIADSAAPIQDERGNTYGVVMVFRDVRQDRAHEEEVLQLSYHDYLTGLYNRRFVTEQIKRLNAAEQLPLSLIIGDVNGLKLTNDAFGHAEGDKLLQRVAAILKSSCREEDTVARWGGDEFLILLPQTSGKAARSIIQRMKNCFTQNSEGLLQISVSLGYAVKETPKEDFKDVLSKAEQWMYYKKLTEGKSYRSTIINTLLATLYENSICTDEHSKRLENYCVNMGIQLSLSAEELNELSLLARLHDVGKIGIHHDILQKPGPLTAEEWKEIQRHPEIGYRIVKNIPELSMVAEYILLHHERWDGKGYPKGNKGYDIPLLCRILAVVDAYDAMTQGRSYQSARSEDDAIAELKQCAGTQFDPQIVDLFIDMIMREPSGQSITEYASRNNLP